jgi:hypothetical protein
LEHDMSAADDAAVHNFIEEGSHLGRTLIASRIVGGSTPPLDAMEILAPVIATGPQAANTLVAALVHTADWAAAILHRHAAVVGMSPEKLFQGISLELNTTPTDSDTVVDITTPDSTP